MTVLVDRDLRALVMPAQPAPPAEMIPALVSATSAEIGLWDSKIQPASLDLTIGRILLPLEKEDAEQPPHTDDSVSLNQGETAVIETHEYLTVPRTVAAIGFPPASVSREGLLMTNPGHVDPGFKGRLKFTVINMGKKPIELAGGKPICTLVFFSVAAPEFAYDQLDKKEKPEAPSERNLLSKLSRDFLNFNQRIKEAAVSAVRSEQINIPIISGIVALFLTILSGIVTTHVSGVNDLRVKVEGLEKAAAVQELRARIEKLEKQGQGIGR